CDGSGLECLEDHEVAQLLRRFSCDCSQSRNICLDRAMAHHLHQCYYHLRLFKNWLISGQDDLECLYGTARLQLALPGCCFCNEKLTNRVVSLAFLIFNCI
uniref:Uncharacterized protein n=1 Tax=Xenopus tropicalis TaxID=8364 RepID=A0A803JV95_XENTR